MEKRVLVPLAEGCEEIEAVTIIDMLRRAGAKVVAAGVTSNPIVASRKVRLMADLDLDEALTEWGDEWDLVVIPGGLGGVDTILKCTPLMELMKRRIASKRPVAAICAGPLVLEAAGLPEDVSLTSHPVVKDQLNRYSNYSEERVVTTDWTVTSRAPGTALEFSLALVRFLYDDARVEEVNAPVFGRI